jgi:tetratricopeptide (TPR) repeat protein
MLLRPADALKAPEGALAEVPLPVLLQALFLEERTCTLLLKVRALEKRIAFEEGTPVGCSSNLLHETLGKILVEKGKITEEQYQRVLGETVQTGVGMGELLVKQGLIAPFDLYRLMQTTLALKILDCFRWVEASYKIIGDVEPGQVPLRVNSAQLVITGVSTFLPFEVVSSQLPIGEGQRFALAERPPHEIGELKLSPKETRLLQLLRGRATFPELQSKGGLDTEATLRRLYAFMVLGLVDVAEKVPERAPPPAATAPAPSAVAAAPAAQAAVPVAESAPAPQPQTATLPEEDDALRNALAAAFMDHRGKDPFDLLGVPEEVQPVALRKAFIALADKFSPVRFRSADLREKAEGLLVAYARAYGSLADPDQLVVWKKRRAAHRAKTVAPRQAEPQFKINTNMLDAQSQFAEGRKRLQANNYKGALEYFQYACDIEPKAVYRAYLAWSRYLLNPVAHARLALQELAEAMRTETTCEEAPYFAGEIHRAQSSFDAAEQAYRAAFKANPQARRYADMAHEMARQKKTAAKS